MNTQFLIKLFASRNDIQFDNLSFNLHQVITLIAINDFNKIGFYCTRTDISKAVNIATNVLTSNGSILNDLLLNALIIERKQKGNESVFMVTDKGKNFIDKIFSDFI